MSPENPFRWRHFEAQIILLNVRWYLRYSLSYRDLEEMMLERGLKVDHSTIYRWVQRYAPELDKRCRPHLKATTDSYRVDETYIKVKKEWKYLYRAVDSDGRTTDFMLSPKRDTKFGICSTVIREPFFLSQYLCKIYLIRFEYVTTPHAFQLRYRKRKWFDATGSRTRTS